MERQTEQNLNSFTCQVTPHSFSRHCTQSTFSPVTQVLECPKMINRTLLIITLLIITISVFFHMINVASEVTGKSLVEPLWNMQNGKTTE